MCSVSLTEGLRKTETHTDTSLISGCAYKLREVQDRCSDNQGDGGRRWGGGLLVLQLVHPSSPVLFCARSLKQGPYTSGETDIQQVSRWLTLSWLREVTMHTDWFCRFSKDLMFWCAPVVVRQSIKWQVGRGRHSKNKWRGPRFMICGNDSEINRVEFPHLQCDLFDIN